MLNLEIANAIVSHINAKMAPHQFALISRRVKHMAQ